jgi:hypothetical protein
MDHALPRSRRAKTREIGRIPPACVEGLSLEERLRLFPRFTVSATGHASLPKLQAGRRMVPKHPTAHPAQVTGTTLQAKPNGTGPTVVAFLGIRTSVGEIAVVVPRPEAVPETKRENREKAQCCTVFAK